MNKIKGFQGTYRFLSNFYPCQMDFEGLNYLSSEAAYQAAKAVDEETKRNFIGITAREARTLGRKIKVRDGWEYDKANVMYRILRAKFSANNGLLKAELLDTNDAYLEETNYWHDTFWGVYNGVGENHLGRLLMLVRDEIREGIV